MGATINNLRSAMLSPSSSLKTLKEAIATLNDQGNIEVKRTTHFAETIITLDDKQYLLSLPLTAEGLAMAESAAAKIHTVKSKIVAEYKILPDELQYIDSLGHLRSCTLTLEQIADGEWLSDCLERLDRKMLASAIAQLEGEFKRLSLSHNNLKTENIILGDDGILYPQRLHHITSNDYNHEEFTTLRSLLCGICLDEYEVISCPILLNTLHGYRSVGNPFEGMCVAENENGFGYISSSGEQLIEPKYIWAGNMREGRAEVETATGMGLIDADGNYIINPRYQIVEFDPESGLSQVKLNDEWMTFDYNGRRIK